MTIRQREKGFTLVEVAISIGILGIIIPAMATTISTLLINHPQASDLNIVSQQVQSVGYWISHDVQEAENVALAEPGGFPLTMVIPVDTNESNDYSVEYVFAGNRLERKVYDSSHTLTGETLIAEYIDVINTVFTIMEPEIYMLTVRATKGEAVAERSYDVTQRLGSL